MTRIALVTVATLLLLAGCGSATVVAPLQTHAPARAALATGTPAHVAVIVMENEEYASIVGSRSTPFINRLAARYALARRMYAAAHPSLPNYLALTGGSTFGISSDCTDCSVHASSLVDQFERAHVSWKAYIEGFSQSCFTGAGAGEYAKKHNPFVYYTRIVRNPKRCRRVVPLARLYADEAARTLPRFVWITPNLCHDMHDCAPARGDQFLARLVPPLLAALGPRSLLVLTWDEGTTNTGCCRLAAGGHIATILAGPAARSRGRLSTPTDTYSVLQTIEDLFRLPRLRGAACACTPSLAPLLARRSGAAAGAVSR